MKRIYLDHAATTPVLPEVVAAMTPWLAQNHGNPSSLHAEGRRARTAIDEARETVAAHLGCLFGEVLFTSSGTEAANMAIIGAAIQARQQGNAKTKILMGAAEHHAVLHTADTLGALGFEVRLIPVDRFARVSKEALVEALDDQTLLVSVMQANNELGTLNDIPALAEIAHRNGALFHTDAVQTFGAQDVKVQNLGVDMLSASAHKIYGPKAVGMLYLKAGIKIAPLISGGGQEREMRAGTENVAGIIGFAEAIRHLQPISAETRDTFRENLDPSFVPTVPKDVPTLNGHLHGRFPGISAENLLIRLDREGISASSGAACSSGSLEPSHVLLAAGYTEAEAGEGLRFTFGRNQTPDDAEEAAGRINHAASQIAQLKR